MNAEGAPVGSGALQGNDAIAAFATIAEAIDMLGALVYVSSYASDQLLDQETHGEPLERKRHG